MRDHLRVVQLVPLETDVLPPGAVCVEDAAAYLGVARETVRRCLSQGLLEATRHERTPGRQGWRWMVDTTDLTRFKRERQSSSS